MMFAPAVSAHAPAWVVSLVASAAVVGLTYWIVAELSDGWYGAAAAVLLLGSRAFRTVSTMLLAQPPVMLLGLLVFLGWLWWRSGRRVGWLLLVGAAAGWAAITRPVDALAFALPVGLGIALDLRGRPWREWARAAAWVVGAAAPFLAIQLVANKGITGHFTETPFRLYTDRNYPQGAFGFRTFDPALRPQSPLPQKSLFYDLYVVPRLKHHTPANLPHELFRLRLDQTLINTLAHPLLLVLLPLGVWRLADRRRRAFVLPVALFLGLYAFYIFFLDHYAAAYAAEVAAAVAWSAEAVERAWPRAANRVRVFFTLAVAALCLTDMPGVGTARPDQNKPAPELMVADRALADVPPPAVVLFHFSDNASDPEQEPVYNADVAWPLDAPVIRAHDMGDARNVEIYRYFAKADPARKFYLFDRGALPAPMTYLGAAGDLAAHPPVLPRANPAHAPWMMSRQSPE